MSEEWVDCTKVFSNGTEYELFLERCDHCTRFRAGRCRVVQACERARWDEQCFPYKDLQDHARYGGKRCRHFTTEKQRRKKRCGRQADGQTKMKLEELTVDEQIRIGRKDGAAATLCWTCENACGGCSWSDHWKHEPVPGWKATRVPIKVNDGYETTYVVQECPEYIPDARTRRKNNGDR